MNIDDRTDIAKNRESSVCPYCWSNSTQNPEIKDIYSHPLKFQPFDTFHSQLFHRSVISNNGLPSHFQEVEQSCIKCKEKFSILKTTKGDQNLQEILINKGKSKTNDRLAFEIFIDYSHENINNLVIIFGLFCIFFGIIEALYGATPTIINYPREMVGLLLFFCGLVILSLGIYLKIKLNGLYHTNESLWKKFCLNTIVVLIMWNILIFLPSIITGSVDKFPNDKPIFITPFLFIGLLTIFQYQLDGVIRKYFVPLSPKIDDLMGRLDPVYKQSFHYNLFRNVSIQRFFFGKRYDRWLDVLTPGVFFGLIGIFIGMFYFVYFLPPLWGYSFSFYEGTTSNPLVYTSWLFNLGWLLFYLPFWILIGTVTWLTLITPYFIDKMSKNLPLSIDHLHDIGGPEIFGDILFKSITSMILLLGGFIVYLIWNYQTPPGTTILLMILLAAAMFLGFFYPLIPIHNKMKAIKSQEIRELRRMIDYEKIKKGTVTPDEIQLNMLRLKIIDKISSQNEWPIRYTIWLKIIPLTLVPFFTIIVDLYILLPKIQQLIPFL